MFKIQEFKFSDIFLVQSGYGFPSKIYSSSLEDTVKLIRIQDINNKSSLKDVRIPKSYIFPKMGNYIVNKGDYLISLSGAAGFHIKKYVGEQGYLNQRIIKVTLRKEYKSYFIDGYEIILFTQVYNHLNTLGRGQNNNLSNGDIENSILKIPIKENGEFDLEKQKEIAEKYEKLEKLKDRIRIIKEDIENQKVEIIAEGNFIEKQLEEIFDLSINTNHSKFTKSFVEKNKGNVPVYSASKSEKLVGYGYVKDNIDGVKYFENCLTWNIDGSVGKAFYRKGRFSLSEKVIPLILFDEYKNQMNIDYIKNILEIEAKKEGFGFSKKAGKGRIKDLTIKFPLKENGEFDLEKQKEIALKYEKLEKMKQTLIEELEYLEKVKVEI